MLNMSVLDERNFDAGPREADIGAHTLSFRKLQHVVVPYNSEEYSIVNTLFRTHADIMSSFGCCS